MFCVSISPDVTARSSCRLAVSTTDAVTRNGHAGKGSSGPQDQRLRAAADSAASSFVGKQAADRGAAEEAGSSELTALKEELAGAKQREAGQVRRNAIHDARSLKPKSEKDRRFAAPGRQLALQHRHSLSEQHQACPLCMAST